MSNNGDRKFDAFDWVTCAVLVFILSCFLCGCGGGGDDEETARDKHKLCDQYNGDAYAMCIAQSRI